MNLKEISLTQIAALAGAVGTIVGAGFTIDSRYAKNSEIEKVRKELSISIDSLHKQILENEQLKQELGNNAQAAKVLAERNKQELAEIRDRLNRESARVIHKTVRTEPPQRVVPDAPEVVDNNSK